MKPNKVIEFYEGSDEHLRMARNPLEYLRSKEILLRHLPPPPAKILDAGGATGAYSFWLAELRYQVTLVDFTPKHIEQALEIQYSTAFRLKAALLGDARELPFSKGEFDAVLLMGPLYHLVERNDRIRVLKEACRVVIPGGPIIAAAISRYASMLDGFFDGLAADPEFVAIMDRDLQTGFHQDTSRSKRYFTDAYLHRPNELEAEFRDSGLIFNGLTAVTGFGWIVPDLKNKLDDPAYREVLLTTLRQVEDRPELMGVSSHFIGVGVRPS